jgi:acetolactate synthase-1/2/3 large subunit
VTIIHNNAAWGIIQAGQRAHLGFELGTSLAGTDYAAIARGFGCLGETVIQPDGFGPALRRALSSGLPAVIDCRTCLCLTHACQHSGRMNQYGFDALTRPVNSAMR